MQQGQEEAYDVEGRVLTGPAAGRPRAASADELDSERELVLLGRLQLLSRSDDSESYEAETATVRGLEGMCSAALRGLTRRTDAFAREQERQGHGPGRWAGDGELLQKLRNRVLDLANDARRRLDKEFRQEQRKVKTLADETRKWRRETLDARRRSERDFAMARQETHKRRSALQDQSGSAAGLGAAQSGSETPTVTDTSTHLGAGTAMPSGTPNSVATPAATATTAGPNGGIGGGGTVGDAPGPKSRERAAQRLRERQRNLDKKEEEEEATYQTAIGKMRSDADRRLHSLSTKRRKIEEQRGHKVVAVLREFRLAAGRVVRDTAEKEGEDAIAVSDLEAAVVAEMPALEPVLSGSGSSRSVLGSGSGSVSGTGLTGTGAGTGTPTAAGGGGGSPADSARGLGLASASASASVSASISDIHGGPPRDGLAVPGSASSAVPGGPVPMLSRRQLMAMLAIAGAAGTGSGDHSESETGMEAELSDRRDDVRRQAE